MSDIEKNNEEYIRKLRGIRIRQARNSSNKSLILDGLGLSKKFVIPTENDLNQINVDIKDYPDLMAKHLKNTFMRLMPREATQIAEYSDIILLPTYDPNAWVTIASDGHPVIAIHSELCTAVWFYNEMMIGCSRIREKDEERANAIHDEALVFIVSCFLEERKEYYPTIDYELTYDDQLMLLSRTYGNELFILAHEFAHIYLGHVGKTVKRTLLSGEKELNKSVLLYEQQQELEADLQAFKWLCNSVYPEDVNIVDFLIKQSPFFSVEIFYLFYLIEIAWKRINKFENTSHPSALHRMRNLCKVSETLMQHQAYSNLGREALTAWLADMESLQRHQ